MAFVLFDVIWCSDDDWLWVLTDPGSKCISTVYEISCVIGKPTKVVVVRAEGGGRQLSVRPRQCLATGSFTRRSSTYTITHSIISQPLSQRDLIKLRNNRLRSITIISRIWIFVYTFISFIWSVCIHRINWFWSSKICYFSLLVFSDFPRGASSTGETYGNKI